MKLITRYSASTIDNANLIWSPRLSSRKLSIAIKPSLTPPLAPAFLLVTTGFSWVPLLLLLRLLVSPPAAASLGDAGAGGVAAGAAALSPSVGSTSLPSFFKSVIFLRCLKKTSSHLAISPLVLRSMMYFIMVLFKNNTQKLMSTLMCVSSTLRTTNVSSTLKLSAQGTSSRRVLEHRINPTSSNLRYFCNFTPRVDARPGKFTGLKNLISLPKPSCEGISVQGVTTRELSFTDSWYHL
mmetsp:Transcript_56979/g.100041  ORF Transcript_56979/g.100041 Transcript_56979/m.100041 type:complete len:239 (+) Transcript_56979:412-1128(+)